MLPETATSPRSHLPRPRSRRDLCPGVLRPWPAEDGALVRVRLIGGQVSAAALRALSRVSQEHGDGDLHLTSRANLQLRGLPHEAERLPERVVSAIESTGLLPSRSHELARNVMASPATGLGGGRVDLRPISAELDRLLCAAPRLAALGGRFLFVLDDGRGDLADRAPDLGLVALDDASAQLRLGSTGWGDTVGIGEAAGALVDLAARFLDLRGESVAAAWHVDELDSPLAASHPRDPRAQVHQEPLPYGPDHVAAPAGVLAPDLVAHLTAPGHDLVVTPWRGVLVPGGAR
ncbi:MAG: nitrite reductase [Pimelobacter sp.]|nr:nitrite reductase [Pimelobacter sp.]